MPLIENPGFEAGVLAPWRSASGASSVVADPVHDGRWSLRLGPGPASVEQSVAVKPGSRYQLEGWLRSGSGAEEVRLGVRGYGGAEKTAASALVAYSRVSVEFETGPADRQATLFILHPSGDSAAHADSLSLEYLGPAAGDAYAGATNSIATLPPRVPGIEFDIAQQPNDRLSWLLDAKFGMFIHWGLYAGPGKGEWYMHNAAIPPDQYRKYAFPESGDEYFSADKYDPGRWAEVAQAAGMKWMCLTARHHDGFCLFDSPHPNAFTSVQTLKRDLVAEYAAACRKARLKVGLYYSPLSWRYPGYYDVTGTDCKKNPFGYHTDPAHKENARLMKEENYANVRHLMSAYGPVDHIFWDGGWLGEQGSDADAAYFHEPGAFLDPKNAWPVGPQYIERDAEGRPLGIMGVVRKHQPHVLVNPRYGWMGDYGDQEGGAAVTGPIRSSELVQKCLTMAGAWGYDRDAVEQGRVFSRDQILDYLVNCVVRDMVMLLNFGPDRHGQMPPIVEQRLREVGRWLNAAGEAIYGTRGGPWHPKDGQYGFCYKGKTIYAHLLRDYSGTTFTLPPVGPLRPVRAYDVFTKQPLPFTVSPDRRVTISQIDRSVNPVDTVIAVHFDRDVMTYTVS
jgi:alpha-L-fucosidase